VLFEDKLESALNASSEGLVEVPSPVAGGGVMVDLKGRFQNTFVATVDGAGQVDATCVPEDQRGAEEGGER
jgi:hypothetical protein